MIGTSRLIVPHGLRGWNSPSVCPKAYAHLISPASGCLSVFEMAEDVDYHLGLVQHQALFTRCQLNCLALAARLTRQMYPS